MMHQESKHTAFCMVSFKLKPVNHRQPHFIHLSGKWSRCSTPQTPNPNTIFFVQRDHCGKEALAWIAYLAVPESWWRDLGMDFSEPTWWLDMTFINLFYLLLLQLGKVYNDFLGKLQRNSRQLPVAKGCLKFCGMNHLMISQSMEFIHPDLKRFTSKTHWDLNIFKQHVQFRCHVLNPRFPRSGFPGPILILGGSSHLLGLSILQVSLTSDSAAVTQLHPQNVGLVTKKHPFFKGHVNSPSL